MLVKYGGGIVQASGSIAGNVFARNRSGNYSRARTKPVNPNSDRQASIRNIMKLLVAYWGSASMSDAERAAWATYASAIAMKNKLGEVINLTGFNHFVRSNAAILTVSGSIVEPGPTVLLLPGGDDTIAVTADAGTQLLTIAFDDTQDWCTEDDAYLSIEMGQPQNPTRNYFGGPYRNAGAIAGVAPGGVASPQTIVAPFTLVSDQKIWVRAAIIRADGRLSNKFLAPALIVGSLLADYHVTGTLSPDITVYNFSLTGAFNGKAYYKADGANFYIWWDGTANWYISVVLGTPGAGHWIRNDPTIVGAYTAVAPNTGVATVVAGPL